MKNTIFTDSKWKGMSACNTHKKNLCKNDLMITKIIRFFLNYIDKQAYKGYYMSESEYTHILNIKVN